VKILALEKKYLKKNHWSKIWRESPPPKKNSKIIPKELKRGQKIKIKSKIIPNYFLKTHKSFWELKI